MVIGTIKLIRDIGFESHFLKVYRKCTLCQVHTCYSANVLIIGNSLLSLSAVISEIFVVFCSQDICTTVSEH